MSLWPVKDKATSSWMDAFYRELLAHGKGAAAAAGAASRTILRSRRQEGLNTHPFYWGGFTTVGDAGYSSKGTLAAVK
jgi:CHAT domain-containing protein